MVFIFIGILFTILGIMGWNYWRLKRVAKLIGNEEFAQLMRKGQVIDLRDAAEFRAKHILGARNIPSPQLKQSLFALRKDQPILLYENARASRVTSAAFLLKKNGYQTIYILQYGLDNWDGKIKKR